MKYFRFFSLLFLIMMDQSLFAQHHLPPVWGNETAEYESRTIAYIAPKRIVWKSATGDAAISGLDNLLKPGIGQAVLSDKGYCHLKNGKTGRVSLLLDFGRELQGGIQIVTGNIG